MKPVLLDAGAIVALFDRTESYHQACAEHIDAQGGQLVTCEAVIAESCHLLRRVPGAADAVIANVEAGIFQIPFSLSSAASQLRRILRKYRDRQVDLADACLIWLATELGTGRILTLDRDFEIYRWGGNRRFELLIPLV